MTKKTQLLNFIKQAKEGVRYDTVTFFVNEYMHPYRISTAERALRQAKEDGLVDFKYSKEGVVVGYTWIDKPTLTCGQLYDTIKVDEKEGVHNPTLF